MFNFINEFVMENFSDRKKEILLLKSDFGTISVSSETVEKIVDKIAVSVEGVHKATTVIEKFSDAELSVKMCLEIITIEGYSIVNIYENINRIVNKQLDFFLESNIIFSMNLRINRIIQQTKVRRRIR